MILNCLKILIFCFLWYRVLDLLLLALNKKLPDILLYGRAGYLYSLLLLKKLGWEDPDRDKLIRKVTNQDKIFLLLLLA